MEPGHRAPNPSEPSCGSYFSSLVSNRMCSSNLALRRFPADRLMRARASWATMRSALRIESRLT